VVCVFLFVFVSATRRDASWLDPPVRSFVPRHLVVFGDADRWFFRDRGPQRNENDTQIERNHRNRTPTGAVKGGGGERAKIWSVWKDR